MPSEVLSCAGDGSWENGIAVISATHLQRLKLKHRLLVTRYWAAFSGKDQVVGLVPIPAVAGSLDAQA